MSKIVKGIIGENGNTESGQGFRSNTWGGAGIYVIQYEQPFQKPPVVICTIAGLEWESYNLSASIVDNSPDLTIISISEPDRPTSASFHFIAMGD